MYLYDIIRQFGSDGLAQLIDYFGGQREEARELISGRRLLDNIILNTCLLTRNELKACNWNELKPLLLNDVYGIYERI